VVLVRGRSSIYLAGPPLVKAAIGEESDEERSAAPRCTPAVTGLGEYLAEDDAHAIALARDLLDKLPWDTGAAASPVFAEPRHDRRELLGMVPADEREPYDVREVIARLVDGSDFLEFKAGYARDTVCGHARLHGHAVGLIGNNGPIQPQGSTKAAQFIQLCDQSGTPLIFLQNTTGYMVGTAAEQAGAIKHGSKMIQAVANARVPKFTVVLGGSFGAGNYGMCGRGFDPRFIFAWPSARTAVMGGAQAAMVMDIVNRAKLAQGRPGGRRQRAAGDERGAAPPARRRKHGPVRHRAAVGRRHHRPARHAPPARPVPGHRRRSRAANPAPEQLRRRACDARSPMMQFTAEHRQLDDTVTRFIEKEVNPFVDDWEKAEQFPSHELFKKLGDLGLLGLKYPRSLWRRGARLQLLDGDGRGPGRCACGGVPMAIGVQTDMATPALARFGSDELRREWLRPRSPATWWLPGRQRARRRLRRVGGQDHGARRRRRLRHQRQQDVDHQRPEGRLVLPAGQHRRHRAAFRPTATRA
jgi:hypothetical protein